MLKMFRNAIQTRRQAKARAQVLADVKGLRQMLAAARAR